MCVCVPINWIRHEVVRASLALRLAILFCAHCQVYLKSMDRADLKRKKSVFAFQERGNLHSPRETKTQPLIQCHNHDGTIFRWMQIEWGRQWARWDTTRKGPLTKYSTKAGEKLKIFNIVDSTKSDIKRDQSRLTVTHTHTHKQQRNKLNMGRTHGFSEEVRRQQAVTQ